MRKEINVVVDNIGNATSFSLIAPTSRLTSSRSYQQINTPKSTTIP
jgi:hypothetical protein